MFKNEDLSGLYPLQGRGDAKWSEHIGISVFRHDTRRDYQDGRLHTGSDPGEGKSEC